MEKAFRRRLFKTIASGDSLDVGYLRHFQGSLHQTHPAGCKWSSIEPNKAGFHAERLHRKLEEIAKLGDQSAIVVVRYGYIVATVGDIREPRRMYSMTKSIAALVFAYLQEKSQVKLDEEVESSNNPEARKATFRQYLNMTSNHGLDPPVAGAYCAYNNEAYNYFAEYLCREFFARLSSCEILQTIFWDHIGRQDSVGSACVWNGLDGGFSISGRDMARIGLPRPPFGSLE
jgi:CubicO group peptidase (beta-lactamase class C family)